MIATNRNESSPEYLSIARLVLSGRFGPQGIHSVTASSRHVNYPAT